VGAPYATAGETNEGIVYLFYGGSGGLSDDARLDARVEPAGRVLRLLLRRGRRRQRRRLRRPRDRRAGRRESPGKSANEGAVYLFAGTGRHSVPHPRRASSTASSSTPGFGTSVAGVGDVDADG
jgi:hypothetical protein